MGRKRFGDALPMNFGKVPLTPVRSKTTPVLPAGILLDKPVPPGSCWLCGALTADFCLYAPRGQVSVGAPVGKLRTFVYRLCDACWGKPGSRERVEQIVAERLARHAGSN
jgi:hypothetical protein